MEFSGIFEELTYHNPATGATRRLVEHFTGITDVMGSNPVYDKPDFFQALVSQLQVMYIATMIKNTFISFSSVKI